MQTMTQRVVGALKLDVATYEEIEHDPAALRQAAILVGVIALVSGLVGGLLNTDNFLAAVIGQLVSAFVGWLVWSVVIWLIGTKVFHGQADLPEMLRVLGFAYAPSVFSALPCINVLVLFWLLATGFVAVRAGLDLDNAQTAFTIILGVIAVVVVTVVIMIPLGLGAALMGGLMQ
jgi:hypothetical protein